MGIIIFQVFILSSCTDSNNNGQTGNAGKPGKIASTLALDKLKGRIKTKKEIVYYKAVQQGDILVPADSNSHYIVLYHYNQDGLITTKETSEITSGSEQSSLREIYTYKGTTPGNIYTINKNGDTLNVTTIEVTGNKQVALTNDSLGKLSSKLVTILDKEFARDSTETFFINEQHQPEWSMVRDFSYNKDGLLEKETVFTLDKDGHVIPEIKNGLTVNYEILSVDNVGNPAKVFMRTLYPNNESFNIIYITTYEYYPE